MSTFGRPFLHEATRQCTLIRLPGAECDDPTATWAIDTAVRTVLADRLRLGGVVVDTACARYRFPRPTVTVVLRTAAPAPDPTPVPGSGGTQTTARVAPDQQGG